MIKNTTVIVGAGSIGQAIIRRVSAGKRIIPFCTNEGSGVGSSVRLIKKLCPGAIVEDGISIHGADAPVADTEAQLIADIAKK